ncbi:MAG: tyrosine-type recombinase/integrase [Desulfobulbus sp.]
MPIPVKSATHSGDSGHPGRSVATRSFIVSQLAVLLFCQWGLFPHRSSFELNDDLLESLQILYRHRQHEQWVFLNEETGDRFRNRRKMMYGINKRAGIDPPIHYHELRHFIASVLADSKSISKKTISEILGHKSLATTEIYLHSIGDSQVVAMKGLEGRFSYGESQTATDNRHQKAE